MSALLIGFGLRLSAWGGAWNAYVAQRYVMTICKTVIVAQFAFAALRKRLDGLLYFCVLIISVFFADISTPVVVRSKSGLMRVVNQERMFELYDSAKSLCIFAGVHVAFLTHSGVQTRVSRNRSSIGVSFVASIHYAGIG